MSLTLSRRSCKASSASMTVLSVVRATVSMPPITPSMRSRTILRKRSSMPALYWSSKVSATAALCPAMMTCASSTSESRSSSSSSCSMTRRALSMLVTPVASRVVESFLPPSGRMMSSSRPGSTVFSSGVFVGLMDGTGCVWVTSGSPAEQDASSVAQSASINSKCVFFIAFRLLDGYCGRLFRRSNM